ncbi:hypothetical protein SEA_LUCHADOR_66 [Mycobacterium phage Luchador]|uniref:Uncharacterized protein n=1 Tax=Mycobacterium phage Luchador TaxID=1647300 RepID=A0A0F6YRN2_9CAUD|nr:hypothetical protein AVT52_gp38 [Mycobacterium phage Luchador]AKF14230.1 hypothetical protein SEA_LUCHADOR_66 [Mycobacterium phage Luchador]
MRLSLKVFGFEVASLDLDLDFPDNPVSADAVKVASKPVKLMSRIWVKGMTA